MSLACVRLSPPAKYDQLLSLQLKINAIARPIMDSQLRNTLTDWLDICGVSQREAFDSCLNARTGLNIAQAIEPFGEEFSFPNFHRRINVANGLQAVNEHFGCDRALRLPALVGPTYRIDPFSVFPPESIMFVSLRREGLYR